MQLAAAGAIFTLVIGYFFLVKSRRWKRYNDIHEEYLSRFKEKTLTPDDAQKIIHAGLHYDMPLLLNYSLAFAIFKTYAIVSTVQNRLLSFLGA